MNFNEIKKKGVGNKKGISLWLPVELIKEFEALCKAEHVAVSSAVEYFMETMLRKHGKKK